MPGLIGGRYEVLAELGRGGMGTVYRARDQVSGQIVAIKVMHPALRNAPNYLERFRREARVSQTIQSEHVVKVLDYGSDQSDIYIAMECVEGKDLKTLIQDDGPLAPVVAKRICLAIATGLAEAHSKGVLHRDIKPQNILVGADGAVKLTDFGIARDQNFNTMTGTGDVLGSIHYIAPEVYRGQSDERSDLYSLGVVFYEMLTGDPPFQGGSPFEIINAQVANAPDLDIPDLEPGIRALIAECLAKEPNGRPQSAAEVVRRLDYTSAGVAGRLPLRRYRMRPPTLVLLALSLLILAGAAFALAGQITDENPASLPATPEARPLTEVWTWRSTTSANTEFEGLAVIQYQYTGDKVSFTWTWTSKGTDGVTILYWVANGTINGDDLVMEGFNLPGKLTARMVGKLDNDGTRVRGVATQVDGTTGTFIGSKLPN